MKNYVILLLMTWYSWCIGFTSYEIVVLNYRS